MRQKKKISNGVKNSKTIVFIGGAFDLFHDGHLITLEKAKKLGDKLVVFVNSDKGIRIRKGNDRPVIPQKTRAQVLKSLEIVDEVLLGKYARHESEDLPLLRKVRPDKWVLSRDPFPDEIKETKRLGIKIVRFPYFRAPSRLNTTKIIEKIRKQNK